MKRRYLYSIFLLSHVLPLCVSAQIKRDSTWSLSLGDFAVVGHRQTSPLKGQADGTIVWDLRQMEDMPKILGNADPVHYTQMLPGVQTNNEFKCGVNIQGCDNSQSMLSAYGVPIYNVSHLLGFFSIFNSPHYPSMTLSPCATEASAPNRLGGQLAMSLSETIPDTLCGEMVVGLISSQGTVRVPIGKKTALNVSLRGSYLNLLYSRWLKVDDKVLKYSFYDSNMTLTHRLDQQNLILVDGYWGNDYVSFSESNYLADMKDNWGNLMGAVHWLHNSRRGLSMKHSLYITSYHNRFSLNMQNRELTMPSSINDLGMRSQLSWKSWNIGADICWHHIKPQHLQNNFLTHTATSAEKTNSLEASVYSDYGIKLSPYTLLTTGLRATLYHLRDFTRASLDPSLSVRYERNRTQLSASYALRHQYLFLTGFSNAGLPTEFWLSSSSKRPPQYAHVFNISASQYLFRRRYRVTANVFYKQLYHQIEYKGSVLDFYNSSATTDDHLLFGKGMNYGFNILLNKCTGRLTGWISYSYTKAKRTFENLSGTFPANHERPHEVNVVAAYQFNKHWNIGATMVYASGTPFTAPTQVALINKNVLITYGSHNGCRLKPYARLDVSVNYKWRSRLFEESGINLSLYNATNHSNDLFYYIKTRDDKSFAYKPVKLAIDILPSVSYFCKF